MNVPTSAQIQTATRQQLLQWQTELAKEYFSPQPSLTQEECQAFKAIRDALDELDQQAGLIKLAARAAIERQNDAGLQRERDKRTLFLAERSRKEAAYRKKRFMTGIVDSKKEFRRP